MLESNESYWVKVCASCGEMMPVAERLCYCSGSVKSIRVGKEEYNRTKEYSVKKWYKGWQNKYE